MGRQSIAKARPKRPPACSIWGCTLHPRPSAQQTSHISRYFFLFCQQLCVVTGCCLVSTALLTPVVLLTSPSSSTGVGNSDLEGGDCTLLGRWEKLGCIRTPDGEGEQVHSTGIYIGEWCLGMHAPLLRHWVAPALPSQHIDRSHIGFNLQST
jgi:hypothetical protein